MTQKSQKLFLLWQRRLHGSRNWLVSESFIKDPDLSCTECWKLTKRLLACFSSKLAFLFLRDLKSSCFLFFVKNNPTLTAFSGVTAHGPSSQPTVLRSPSCCLSITILRNQALFVAWFCAREQKVVVNPLWQIVHTLQFVNVTSATYSVPRFGKNLSLFQKIGSTLDCS